jgi:hypothetical protein
MTTYRFTSDINGDRSGEDLVELATDDEVKAEAVKRMCELLKTSGREALWSTGALVMTASNADGLVVFRLDLHATLAPAWSDRQPKPGRAGR